MTGAAQDDHRASAESYLRSAMELPEGSPETLVYAVTAVAYAIFALHDDLLGMYIARGGESR